LTAIEVGCNMSTGYPYWVFHFEDKVWLKQYIYWNWKDM
jgi:hypothetical protein